ncbi:glycosyltransferase [Spirosoma sp. BT702]|uniref:Glycosyltransferase n=1 Tax=Spirosoma profusum TaxID=2771354 RepID=A0A926XYX6_9BACT|nr:glycosyltransferase family 2 protein [Spirosoma profusum]MBD2700682.1 glycosyltransferase [Spirosoma profusum]
MPKKLSIITINWNNAAGLRQTLESVTSQLTSDCEYVVIDGNSDDGSQNVIREYADRLTYWQSEPKAGIYADMNKGIAKATGEYCLFLNAGDWLVNDVLPKAVNECTGEDVIYFNTYLSYDNTRIEALRYSPTLTMRNFFKSTIGHQSTLIKRELFNRYGMYDETLRLHGDYAFWLKSIILENATCKYVNKFLSYYDMGGQTANPNEYTLQEVSTVLSQSLPKRVLDDYDYWHKRERELEILVWYKNQKMLYGGLVFLYKVVKNLHRLMA